MAQHALRHTPRARYEHDYDDRRYADEDYGPRRRQPEPAPRRGGVLGAVFVFILTIALVVFIVAILPDAWRAYTWLAHPASSATTTALPTANMTPFPTQPVTQPGALVATPVPARQPAPTDAPACVPVAGGVDLHVGSDGASATIGNGQTCPEQQDMAVENAPAPDYGPNRDATGAWVGPTDAPVPTLAPTQATAFVAQFKPATNNNAFVGYLPGRAPPTPWPTASGVQPGDPGFAESFK